MVRIRTVGACEGSSEQRSAPFSAPEAQSGSALVAAVQLGAAWRKVGEEEGKSPAS